MLIQNFLYTGMTMPFLSLLPSLTSNFARFGFELQPFPIDFIPPLLFGMHFQHIDIFGINVSGGMCPAEVAIYPVKGRNSTMKI